MLGNRLDEIEKILTDAEKLPALAIETGTGRGNGTRILARRFARVVTLELSPEMHLHARRRLEDDGIKNVEFLQGDSPDLLSEILLSLPPTEAVFFFLDAHWSGDQTVDWNLSRWKGYGIDTAHRGPAGRNPTGHEQCPLDEELRVIATACRGPTFILIDDLKNLPPSGTGLKDLEFAGEDWSHLSREALLDIVRPRLESVREFAKPSQWFFTLSPITQR